MQGIFSFFKGAKHPSTVRKEDANLYLFKLYHCKLSLGILFIYMYLLSQFDQLLMTIIIKLDSTILISFRLDNYSKQLLNQYYYYSNIAYTVLLVLCQKYRQFILDYLICSLNKWCYVFKAFPWFAYGFKSLHSIVIDSQKKILFLTENY